MASLSRTLLVVCPEGPALRVFTCFAGLRGWSLGRDERVQLPLAESQAGTQSDLQAALQSAEIIAAAVRPLVLRWGIAPGTEVALVLPAVAGGVVSLAGPPPGRGASVDAPWLERELAGRIPFALKDIEYDARAEQSGHARTVQVAWLPRATAVELRAAFARLGLVLGDMVFRAQLHAAALRKQGTAAELLIERGTGWCCLHLLAGGRVMRTSTAQTLTPRAFADRLRLELLSCEIKSGIKSRNENATETGSASPAATAVDSTDLSRIVLTGEKNTSDGEFETAAKDAAGGIKMERRSADISELFVRFWRAGGTGIWLVPENPPQLAMARRIAFAIAGCGALLVMALAWDASTLRSEIAALEAREARLQPQYKALVAKERQAAADGAIADSVARLAPGEPQAALLAVFNALPRSAWVTRFSFEQGKVTVAGRGMDTESVIAELKQQPGVSATTAAPGAEPEGSGGDTGFRVWFQWAPDAAAKGAR